MAPGALTRRTLREMGGSARRAGPVLAALALGLSNASALAGKAEAPVPAATVALMSARNTTESAPILMRVFKREAELEVWKLARDGRYVHLKTFPICRWSGQLGPKRKQGDRMTPEGFYPIAPRQMNPNSAYYLSFDTGFPNAYDRAHGYTGSALMVHGTCSSAGCFAMTDRQVGEIYALAREAFAGGQRAFQFQAYPFRMTAQNMARYRTDANIAFWRQLKEGYDRFEATGEEPVVGVANGRYAFAASRDPLREAKAQARIAEEAARTATLVNDGVAAMRAVYSDGGQHPTFAALARAGASLGDISRPEALVLAGREVVVVPARRKPACPGPACPTQVASASPSAFQGAASTSIPAGARADAATPAAAPAPFSLSALEPSVFSFAALTYGPVPPTLLGAPISGGTRMVPAVLALASLGPGAR